MQRDGGEIDVSPVSQSSSLLRQQSPQPSHRLSHSSRLISSSVLRFQKGASFIIRFLATAPANQRETPSTLLLSTAKSINYSACFFIEERSAEDWLCSDAWLASRQARSGGNVERAGSGSSRKTPAQEPHILLRIDSWINSTLWNAGFRSAEIWEDITIFFRRFRVRGWKRIVFELAGEGLTLGRGRFRADAGARPARLRGYQGQTGATQAISPSPSSTATATSSAIAASSIENSVPIDELPDSLIKAVLATEDRRFFDHFGIDFIGLFRAMSENARAGGVVQGGSTLTQQLAKNLFLSNERSIDRKIKEAFLASGSRPTCRRRKSSRTLSRPRLYGRRHLRRGGGGAVLFRQEHHRCQPRRKSAMLAGLFKAPAKYAPHVNLPAARARANEVLTNLVQGGLMTEGQVIAARRNPATVVDRTRGEAPDFFLDWAFDEVQRHRRALPPAFADRAHHDRHGPAAGGRRFGRDVAARNMARAYHVKQGAMVMIENGGAVRAMVGGRDYGESQFNRATKALRQPGSSFKVYTYAVAMENGMTPEIDHQSMRRSTWGNW